jgi:predicted ATPase
MASGNYADPDLERTYLRARELSQRVDDAGLQFTATWGLWQSNQMRLQVETGRGLANELLALARRQPDSGLLLQSHHAAWTTLLCVPNLSDCLAHTEEGMALYDVEEHRAHKFLYAGHDPGTCCRNHRAMVLWLLGYPDQATATARDAIALSWRLEHAGAMQDFG